MVCMDEGDTNLTSICPPLDTCTEFPRAKVTELQSKEDAGDTLYMFDCFNILGYEAGENENVPISFDGCLGIKFNAQIHIKLQCSDN